jgi:hypothetical protein
MEETQTSEVTVAKLRETCDKQRLELDHAKRNIINYIVSVKQLEKVIDSKNSNTLSG